MMQMNPQQLMQEFGKFVQKHHLKQAGGGGKAPKGVDLTCAKDHLNAAFAMLLGRSGTKDDLVYAMEESNGVYTATLTISAFSQLDPTKCMFTGQPGENKKEAENNACQMFLDAFAIEIAANKEIK